MHVRLNVRIILLQEIYNIDLNFTGCSIRSGVRFKCLPGKILHKYIYCTILYTKFYLNENRTQRQNS